MRRSDMHNEHPKKYPAKSSTDNKPSSERQPGMDNLRMTMLNPKTVLSGFKFVGNHRGPVLDYGGGSGGYHNPGKHVRY